MATLDGTPHLPGRYAIESFGAGGFRFGDMSHRGSLLILPSGMWAWPVGEPAAVDAASLERLFAESGEVDLFIFGSGTNLRPLPAALHARLRGLGMAVESMATAHAAHTYNILLAESRRIAAGLIAVD
ncbi:Mth938-like domain-containing protein [Blastochloris sulfoviridis]|uniref:Mth938-like domain-containing protein n=1 Tax=Blastochloris sulfoviridis TaxID=50712 RepID=A0A5M6I1L9_9HYPH|nr:MTH938/NDUFAF3 family protein [Blastochloris sulfoviridis]KAA5602094.1 hypothetical protein F1193_06915 [Blastochloris sulfoviridis]